MSIVEQGGFGGKDDVARDAATLAKLHAVPTGIRKWGMLVTVYADAIPGNNITWYLKYNNNSTNKNDNANWVDASTVFGGGGGGSGNVVFKSRNYDASGGAFPAGPPAASTETWVYIVGVGKGGNVGGLDLVEGAILFSTIDNPGNNWIDWNLHQ